MSEVARVMIGVVILCIGAFISIWYMLIGGIVDLIEVIKSTETDAMLVGTGIVKIIFFVFPMYISALIVAIVVE